MYPPIPDNLYKTKSAGFTASGMGAQCHGNIDLKTFRVELYNTKDYPEHDKYGVKFKAHFHKSADTQFLRIMVAHHRISRTWTSLSDWPHDADRVPTLYYQEPATWALQCRITSISTINGQESIFWPPCEFPNLSTDLWPLGWTELVAIMLAIENKLRECSLTTPHLIDDEGGEYMGFYEYKPMLLEALLRKAATADQKALANTKEA